MKKTISFFLALIMVCSCFAFRSPEANALGAVWVKEFYKDKFGDKTSEYYLTNKSQFKGTYNSNTVSNGKLEASIIFERRDDELNSYIILYLKGSEQIKNSSSSDIYYSIATKRTDGSQISATGILRVGSDRIELWDGTIEFAASLSASKEISIYIEETKNTANNYLFKAKSGNFEDLFNKEILIPYQEEQYQKAEQMLRNKQFDTAATLFSSISDYKDSEARAIEVQEAKKAYAYEQAENLLKQNKFDEAEEAFRALGSYNDSAARVTEVQEAKKAYAYEQAENLLKQNKFDEAEEAFRALGSYNDSAARVTEVQEARRADDYAKAEELLRQKKYDEAEHIFSCLGDYEDCKEKVKEVREKRTEAWYQEALSLYEGGKYKEAYLLFLELKGYKDVDDLLKSDKNLLEVVAKEERRIAFSTVGNEVTFGRYEQDNDTSNGDEGIDWIVLASKNNQSLLVSKYGLARKQYNTKMDYINWSTCSLREWLTSSFFNIAFNKNERAAIVQTDVSYDAWRNQDQVIKDYVFILSMDEVLEYMRSEEDRLCTKTWYAVVEAGMEKYENSGDPAHWWLRDRYNDLRQAYYIKNDGELSYGDDGRMHYDFYAYVRPAVWVDLEADFFN